MAKLKASYRILSVTNRSGTRSYQVSGTNPEGQRIRKAFTSRDEATRYRQKLESDQPETAETFARTALSADQLSDASVAFGLLGSKPPTTLVAAVKHWLQNPPPKKCKATVSEVRKLFLEETAMWGGRYWTSGLSAPLQTAHATTPVTAAKVPPNI